MHHTFPVQKIKYLLLFLLFSWIFIPARTIKAQSADSVLTRQRTFTAEELIRGERLFFGLVYLENKSINCAACHNTAESDTLNWNPDAMEISLKYKEKTAADLSRVLLKPVGTKMGQAHNEFQLSSEDIVLIKSYMDKFTEIGLKKGKPVITNLLLFIIAILLFLVSAVDLIMKKSFVRRLINTFVLLATGFFMTYSIVVNALAVGIVLPPIVKLQEYHQ
jgi:hypothetical protein